MTTHPGPYKLNIHWRHGVIQMIEQGHCPSIVRQAERRIARNANVIDKIVLTDLCGPLETIWSRTWIDRVNSLDAILRTNKEPTE